MPVPFLSLADIGQLPALPMGSKIVLLIVGSFFSGYLVGGFDRDRKEVSVDWKPERRKSIAPLTTAEIEASTTLGDNVGKTAMGITMPTEDEIKARQDRLRGHLTGVSFTTTGGGAGIVAKPITRGSGRNSKGQFLPRAK